MTRAHDRHDVAPLTAVPTLDELAADPARAAALPLDAVRALLTRCAVAQAVLLPRVLEPAPDGHNRAEVDRLLKARAAAERLGVSEDYVYRHANTFPFTRRLGRSLRFSEQAIERYLQARRPR